MSETAATFVTQREARETSPACRNNDGRKLATPCRASRQPWDGGRNTVARSLPHATRVCSWSPTRRSLALTIARYPLRTGYAAAQTMFA